MEFLKILLLCMVGASLYGIAHDQVTARICLEYFTVFHPPVFDTQSPTVLALGWGVIATWWAGLFIGTPLAIASRAGSVPKVSARDLVRPVGTILAIMAACAVLAGIIGYLWGQTPKSVAATLPYNLHRRFVTDMWAHSASYISGFVGGLVLCISILRRRFHSTPIWTRSKRKQAVIALACAVLSALSVLSYEVSKSIQDFYFEHQEYLQAQTHPTNAYLICTVTFLGVFLLVYYAQRLFTTKRTVPAAPSTLRRSSNPP
jgi:hypothetical protein